VAQSRREVKGVFSKTFKEKHQMNASNSELAHQSAHANVQRPGYFQERCDGTFHNTSFHPANKIMMKVSGFYKSFTKSRM